MALNKFRVKIALTSSETKSTLG